MGETGGHLFPVLETDPWGGSRFPESRFAGVMMDTTQYLGQSAKAAWAEEIERAIDNVKRTGWDKQFRREWHRAAWRRGRLPAPRRAEKARRSRRTSTRDAHPRAANASCRPQRVWVRGRVPREFLDWLARQEGSDPEEREMLAECFLEEWER